MYKIMILALCASSLMACTTVSIDSDDQTVPSLSLTLVGVDAIYSDGSMVEGPIDFLRRPTVQTGQGNVSFPVVVAARDEDSGIETVSASLTLTGYCNYSFLNTPVSEDISLRFSDRNDPGVDEEGEAFVQGLAVISITPTDIWQRSRCDRFSVSNGRARATLTSLEVRYNIVSTNNAGLENRRSGSFEIERLVIDFPAF